MTSVFSLREPRVNSALEEFIEHFGESVGLAEWQKASPVHAPSSHQMERRSAPCRDIESVMADEEESDDKTFLDIKRALMTLLDECDVVGAPRRRRITNTKLLRRALMWSRFVKKGLLFLRNGHTGRLGSGRCFRIAA